MYINTFPLTLTGYEDANQTCSPRPASCTAQENLEENMPLAKQFDAKQFDAWCESMEGRRAPRRGAMTLNTQIKGR